MASLLILTVGTGTAGKHSNLAQGLVNTLAQTRSRLFWLVPSTSEDSIALAHIVREQAPEGCRCASWSPTQPFRCIGRPDSLFDCREALREVIQIARQHLAKGEELIVNPTSGTKQMSVGATLAALGEGIGKIVFTVGERADGVVKTGTERMASFSTHQFFLERDLRLASELYAAGAFSAAAGVLRAYPDDEVLPAREKALCLHEWQRFNHVKAATHAARFSEDLHRHLVRLAQADDFSVLKLGDLLAGADELMRWGDFEEALARYYRGAEQTAKVRLASAHDVRPPYALEAVRQLVPSASRLARTLQEKARRGRLLLTAQLAWDLLDSAGDPMAADYFADQVLQDGLQKRNDSLYGHGQVPIHREHAETVANCLRRLLTGHLPTVVFCWTTSNRPRALTGS